MTLILVPLPAHSEVASMSALKSATSICPWRCLTSISARVSRSHVVSSATRSSPALAGDGDGAAATLRVVSDRGGEAGGREPGGLAIGGAAAGGGGATPLPAIHASALSTAACAVLTSGCAGVKWASLSARSARAAASVASGEALLLERRARSAPERPSAGTTSSGDSDRSAAPGATLEGA